MKKQYIEPKVPVEAPIPSVKKSGRMFSCFIEEEDANNYGRFDWEGGPQI